MPHYSFCDIFYEEVETKELCGSVTVNDRKIRGGTTLHELTHAVAGTEDVGYGCEDNMKLSPDQALSNADNYNVCLADLDVLCDLR